MKTLSTKLLFSCSSRIANNLILKPWRKEFHRICIYNGHFKHLISQQIPHYEHILKLMGYELKSKNGILNYFLGKRNNQEVLKLISFDCYVAYVEFRYIYQFGYQILSSKNIKPNWQYIFRLRKKFTGDFESTLDNYLLIYNDQINEQQQQINRKYKHLSNLISQYEQNQQQADFIEKQTNSNLIDLESLPSTNKSYDSLEQLLLNSSPPDTANYQSTVSYNHQPMHTNNRPTNSYLQCSDDYYLTKHNLTNSFNGNFNNNNNNTNHQYQVPNETNLDQVDFIDDVDEDDALAINLKDELNSKIKYLDNNSQKLEQAMKSNDDRLNNGLINGKIKSNSLEKKSNKTRLVEKKYSTLDLKGDKKKSNQQKGKWVCKHCTYMNQPKDTICKMCSKSMNKIDNNELTVLGKECNLCTLVNSPSEDSCRACDNSLKNSPTYI